MLFPRTHQPDQKTSPVQTLLVHISPGFSSSSAEPLCPTVAVARKANGNVHISVCFVHYSASQRNVAMFHSTARPPVLSGATSYRRQAPGSKTVTMFLASAEVGRPPVLPETRYPAATLCGVAGEDQTKFVLRRCLFGISMALTCKGQEPPMMPAWMATPVTTARSGSTDVLGSLPK